MSSIKCFIDISSLKALIDRHIVPIFPTGNKDRIEVIIDLADLDPNIRHEPGDLSSVLFAKFL